MTMLELATRNADYDSESKIDVKYNGNWIGILTVEELVYNYGLCEIVNFSSRQISLIGGKLS